MYVTLYQWEIKSGREQSFTEAWAQLTRHLQTKIPTLSGNLYKTIQGNYVGMINWPNKESWESQIPDNISLSIQQRLMDSVTNVESLFVMEQVKAINPLP